MLDEYWCLQGTVKVVQSTCRTYVSITREIYVAVRKSVKSAQPPRQRWEEESCRRARDPQRTAGAGLDRVERARSDGRGPVRKKN